MTFYAIHAIRTRANGTANGDWELCPMEPWNNTNPSKPAEIIPEWNEDDEDESPPVDPAKDYDWQYVTTDVEYAIETAGEISDREGFSEYDRKEYDVDLFVCVRKLSKPPITVSRYSETYDHTIDLLSGDQKRDAKIIDAVTRSANPYLGKDIWTNGVRLKQAPPRRTLAQSINHRFPQCLECHNDVDQQIAVGDHYIHCNQCVKIHGRKTKSTMSPSDKTDLRVKQFNANDRMCPICMRGLPFDMMQLDRIVPGTKGGEYNENNLQTICRTCNIVKGNKTDMPYSDIRKQTLALANLPNLKKYR